jgi:hypothetical protein
MDQTKFVNTYIQKLSESIRSLTMEKIALETQLAMANEELNELRNKMNEMKPNTEEGA